MSFFRYFFAETKGKITLDSFRYQHSQFIGKPHNSLLFPEKEVTNPTYLKNYLHYNTAMLARQAYIARTQQAFGLGFIFSFIPFFSFTKTFYEARQNYIKAIHAFDKHVTQQNTLRAWWDKERISFSIATSSWFSLLHPISTAFLEPLHGMKKSMEIDKESRKKMFLQSIPLYQDVMFSESESTLITIARLFHAVLNPFKLASDILRFVNYGYNYLCDKTDDSFLWNTLLKAPNYLLFLPLRLVFRTLETLLDLIIFYPIKLLTTPAVFFAQSIYHTIKYRNYTFKNEPVANIISRNLVSEAPIAQPSIIRLYRLQQNDALRHDVLEASNSNTYQPWLFKPLIKERKRRNMPHPSEKEIIQEITTTHFSKNRPQYLAAKMLFPVKKQDWYSNKGYGSKEKDAFQDFLEQQQSNPEAHYYQEFQNLLIQRKFIDCRDYRGNANRLDSISLKPLNSENTDGHGLHIINFFGRGEYYEMNFRDMAKQANASGATIYAYNPPGMNTSTGQVRELNDLINAGIAQINDLLQQGIHPDQIILQGNCLGAAVAEEVNKHFQRKVDIQFRRINSNSFKSLNSLLTHLYPLLGKRKVKSKVKKFLQHTGWYTRPGADFIDTNPYKVYMNRPEDKTIKPAAQMQSKVAKEKLKETSQEEIDAEYEAHRKWLDEHAAMELIKEEVDAKDLQKNIHEMDLYQLQSVNTNEQCTAYEFINRYIRASNTYIAKHPQSWETIRLASYKQNSMPNRFHSNNAEDIKEIVNEIAQAANVFNINEVSDSSNSFESIA